MTKALRGAEAILELCRVQEIDYIFCSPIAVWAPLWEALAERAATTRNDQPTYINCRHELLAVGLASGFYKASGRPQVVLLPTGLGVLNGSMGLQSAMQERTPMVVLSPDSMTYGADPELDPGPEWPSLLVDLPGPSRHSEAVVKWTREIKTPADLITEFRRACHFAESVPRGPTLLSVPFDILMQPVPSVPQARIEPMQVVAPDDVLERLADSLVTASSPIVITDHAGHRTSHVESLVEIAEAVGAPVFEFMNPQYQNVPRDHPLHGKDPVESHLKDADCVLIAGSNGPWHPPLTEMAEQATVIHMEEDPLRPRAPYWGYRSDQCIAGDLGANLSRLRDTLKKRGRTPDEDQQVAARTAAWTARHKAVAAQWRAESEEASEGRVADTALFRTLNRMLPDRSVIVDETVAQVPAMLKHLFHGRNFDHIRGWHGALGVGMPTALGVKLARPEALVVSVIGDGAFHYNPVPACFGLAQQYGVPILVVLCDNCGYVSQEWNLQKYFPQGYALRTNNPYGRVIEPTPDYTKLAEAYGGYGERVARAEDLEPALSRALEAIATGRLALLDVLVAG